jgi:hypothetical protein
MERRFILSSQLVDKSLVHVTPHPFMTFSTPDRLNNWVVSLLKMMMRMLPFGVLAAADIPAAHALGEVDPTRSCCLTFPATDLLNFTHVMNLV